MSKEPVKTSGKPMTAAETQAAADAEAYNQKQTSGYDQSKGPSGTDRPTAKSWPLVAGDEIRDAIDGVVEGFRGRTDKDAVVNMLHTAAELLNRSGDWVRDPSTLDYDPDDLDDPRANPLGVRPSPAGATRADEETAPEPDSRGNIGDRLAAEDDVPPPDRDAVAAKRGAEKAAAEHKDDPKKRR